MEKSSRKETTQKQKKQQQSKHPWNGMISWSQSHRAMIAAEGQVKSWLMFIVLFFNSLSSREML